MSAAIAFSVATEEPHSHRLQVEMRIEEVEEEQLVLRMPVWTPGSYKVREYSKHVQRLEVRTEEGRECAVKKIDKAGWRVGADGAKTLIVTYEVYAHELSPRHNHVDGSHAFFNCVATCMYPEGRLDEPVELRVLAPKEDWEVFCGLERMEGEVARFVAQDFDELFDTPVEVGPHSYFEVEVRGVRHRFVVWSDEELDLEPLRRDLPVVIEENAEMFGGLPYERYLFINHVARGVWGGLEHRHSSVNLFSPEHFDATERDEEGELGEKYANILRLLSHEHFHAYHIKRLRPVELGPFDYQGENYTTSLWAVEGVVSYFDTYQLRRSGLIGARRYMELLEKRIAKLEAAPGRREQSLEEASFDAWIRLYRPDEDTRNSTVSYYLKGELVVWLLDLWIRDQSDGERTMADVLRQMWREYYVERDVGFAQGDVEEAVSEQAGADASAVFDQLVRGRGPIEWEEFLGPVGLELCPEDECEEAGWIGVKTKKSAGRVEVSSVARGGPSEGAGVYAGDEIVAVNGWNVRDKDVEDLIGEIAPGEVVNFHLFRRHRLHHVSIVCEEAPPSSYRLKPAEEMSPRQRKLLKSWLGVTQWKTD